ncbi:MAG: Molybdenum ABC transporter, substrate-binding protein ModA, partial [uncultured Acetobacteraceae bacterium]
ASPLVAPRLRLLRLPARARRRGAGAGRGAADRFRRGLVAGRPARDRARLARRLARQPAAAPFLRRVLRARAADRAGRAGGPLRLGRRALDGLPPATEPDRAGNARQPARQRAGAGGAGERRGPAARARARHGLGGAARPGRAARHRRPGARAGRALRASGAGVDGAVAGAVAAPRARGQRPLRPAAGGARRSAARHCLRDGRPLEPGRAGARDLPRREPPARDLPLRGHAPRRGGPAGADAARLPDRAGHGGGLGPLRLFPRRPV